MDSTDEQSTNASGSRPESLLGAFRFQLSTSQRLALPRATSQPPLKRPTLHGQENAGGTHPNVDAIEDLVSSAVTNLSTQVISPLANKVNDMQRCSDKMVVESGEGRPAKQRCLDSDRAQRIERAKVFLGGIFRQQSPGELERYLKTITDFHGEVTVEVVGKFGRATFKGIGAHRAALMAIGMSDHAEKSRMLSQVKEDAKDWFCPCGRSGPQALFGDARCPACRSCRPINLQAAAEAAESTNTVCEHVDVSPLNLACEQVNFPAPKSAVSVQQAAPVHRPRFPDDLWRNLLGAHLVWKHMPEGIVSKRLDMCLCYCQQNSGWRTWAYDLFAPDSDGGRGTPKRFIAAPFKNFAEAYAKCPGDDRHAYEVIPADQACRIYFDLEFAKSATLNQSIDGDRLTRLILDETKAIISRTWKSQKSTRSAMDASLDFEFLSLDSHTEAKWSRHLLVSPSEVSQAGEWKPILLRNFFHAGVLAKTIAAKLASELQVDRLPTSVEESAEVTSIVDSSIYTQNRLFRLIFSSKLKNASGTTNGQPHFAPNPEMSLLRKNPGNNVESWLAHSLVVSEANHVEPLIIDIGSGAEPAIQLKQSKDLGAARRAASSERVDAGVDVVEPLPKQAKRRLTLDEWMESLEGTTGAPLLELPLGVGGAGSHPFIVASTKGKGYPPPPFEALAAWAEQQFKSWTTNNSDKVAVQDWAYVRAEHPAEALLHLTAAGTRFCFNKNREHKSQKVMLSINLLSHSAFQRCWDQECVITRCTPSGARRTFKFTHALSRPPATSIPWRRQLDAFERKHGLVNE